MTDPNRPDLEGQLIDTRKTCPLDRDPFTGAPRRIERRMVFGHLTGDYRVTVCQPATHDDLLSGRAERLDPRDPDSAIVAWRPLSDWQTLSDPQTLTVADPLVDPNGMIN